MNWCTIHNIEHLWKLLRQSSFCQICKIDCCHLILHFAARHQGWFCFDKRDKKKRRLIKLGVNKLWIHSKAYLIKNMSECLTHNFKSSPRTNRWHSGFFRFSFTQPSSKSIKPVRERNIWIKSKHFQMFENLAW